jgi:alkylation response protein AidB-like acyl-CoA dehydrogenase
MTFEFDDTARAVEQMARELCRREVDPVVADLEAGRVSVFEVMRRLAAALHLDTMVADPLRRRIARLRAGDTAPRGDAPDRALGDPAIAAAFVKEVARSSPGVALSIIANFGCGVTIAARGDADLVERCALPVLTFAKVGCWALTEPDTGSDAFAMRTTVRVDGAAAIVTGTKTFISNAPAADVILVYARCDGGGAAGSRDKMAILPVVVERATPGVTLGPPMAKMGMHASPTGEIAFDEVRVPRSHLLGDPARPQRAAAEQTLAGERAAIVALCLGVIERCLDDALAYATVREQFGRPLAGFQLTQAKLARMYVHRQNVKNLLLECIDLDRRAAARPRQVSAAKWYATEAALEVADAAIQILGGAGYVQGHAPERLYRDMRLWTIGGGTSEVQLLTIAKDLLRDRGFRAELDGEWERRGGR